MIDQYDIDDEESRKDFAAYLEEWREYVSDYDDDTFV